jgi:DNA repair protein RadA/Sms
MAKSHKNYTCQSCGAVSHRWSGKCDSCNEWNCIVEETAAAAAPPKGLGGGKKGRRIEFVKLDDPSARKNYPRHVTGIQELDRVTGGGLVPGSATLIGGDPGIGKSTLLLQAVCALAKKKIRCLYISGEESVEQVRMRAGRLGLADAPVELAAATNVRDIVASMDDPGVSVMIIDSIQTMFIDSIDSAPGTVTQVRTSAQEIVRVAKAKNIGKKYRGDFCRPCDERRTDRGSARARAYGGYRSVF